MNMTISFLLQLIYFFIPGYVANGSPPIIAKLFPRWKTPLDFGKTWNGRRIFGENKSWRGVIGGTVLGGVVFLLQVTYASVTPTIPYSSLPWWFGFLFSFGAIGLGDAGKSFLKRRFDIEPGRSWIPFDQIDYTVGAFLLTFWLFWPGWLAFLLLLLFNGFLSMGAHYLASTMRLTKETI